MKKSLLALAVLTAVAGAASAQSSVTLYGKIDVGGVYEAGTPRGKTVRIATGVSGGSRLGFKGVEDLGGGLKAGFQLETGFCADSNEGAVNFCTGGNNFLGRQAHVDLSGAFGSITAGRQYSLAFINLTTIDPFGTGLAGQVTNLADSAASGQANPRVNNSVVYTTPNLGGVSVGVMAGFGETTGNWTAGRSTGAVASYASGPLYAGVAYHDVNNAVGQLGRKNINGGLTYDLGVIKLHGFYQSTKSAISAAPVLTVNPLANEWVDSRDLMAGVTVPLGSGALLASYVRHDDRTLADKNASQFGVGYIYALSKRTSIYAAAAKINNQNGALFTVGNASIGGTGNKAGNLGVVHNF